MIESRQKGGVVTATLLISAAMFGTPTTGCFPCGTMSAKRLLKGRILDRDSLQAPTDVTRITAVSLTGGETTGGGGAGTAMVVPSPEDGAFELRMSSSDKVGACGNPPFTRTTGVSQYPPPDQIVLTVEREACEQEFTIDLNEDTVVDPDFPDGVIELAEPILLPPCAQNESGS